VISGYLWVLENEKMNKEERRKQNSLGNQKY
jgi:hypothetical protein